MIEETGVGIKNPLWFVGVVENRDDPRKEGRVQVRAFGVHGTNAQVRTELLPWAICISGNYDPNYPIPPLNSWVFGFFLDGRDAQQPMILGLIPTQMTALVEPEVNGWGVIPTENVNLHSQGSRAIDFGQPMNSRKARGEDLDKTDILLQEVNRVKVDFSSLEDGFKLEEPSPGNQSIYPFNRVTETAGGHSIELDDSPGAERVRVGHANGSYIEMHQTGAVVVKSAGDMWIVAESNINMISQGRNLIKVQGDAVVSVEGNMTHEVNGDMTQIVRGNYELSVAGQLNLNGSEEIQARAGKIRIESNVEGINLKSSKKINIQSGEVINIKSGQGIFQEAAEDINIKGDNLFVQSAGEFNIKSGADMFQESASNINIKGGSNLFIQGTGNTNIKSSQVFLDASGNMNIRAAYTKIGNGQISLNGTTVAIDDIVYLASGEAVNAPAGSDASSSTDAITASPAEGSDMPEPSAKSVGNGNGTSSTGSGGGGLSGGGYKNPSSGGSGGYVSQDDNPGGNLSVSSSNPTTSGDKLIEAIGGNIAGLTESQTLAYLNGLGQRESGNNYSKVNSLGYLGKYQFGAKALEDLGLLRTGASKLGTVDAVLSNPDNWSGRYGISSRQDWLNNPTVQEKVMIDYTNRNFAGLQRRGIITSSSTPSEISGYLAGAHLGGPGGVQAFLQGRDRKDAYGTSIGAYIRLGRSWVQ
jgi:hypothetical protein